jgi:hypothetical protein
MSYALCPGLKSAAIGITAETLYTTLFKNERASTFGACPSLKSQA